VTRLSLWRELLTVGHHCCANNPAYIINTYLENINGLHTCKIVNIMYICQVTTDFTRDEVRIKYK
jgi:hypothetical protein